jgi:hypothetical protein
MQKSGSILSLDSRNRINSSTPSNCIFKLQNALNSSKFELITFSFANTLWNVTSSTNTLFIGGVLAATITPGYYSASSFVAALETQLETFFAGVGPYVSLNTATNVLTWSLGVNQTITSSPMNRILGVYTTMTNSFTTSLFLVGCTNLNITCPQLSAFSYNGFPSTNRVSICVPVNSGYGDFQVWEPSRGACLEFSKVHSDTLQITISDSHSDQDVNIGEWSCTFVVS